MRSGRSWASNRTPRGHRRTPSVGPFDAPEPRTKGIRMKEINPWARRGATWVGRAALLCLGIFAMLVLVVVAAVLVPVMLTASATPRARHGRGADRETGDTPISTRNPRRGAEPGLPEGDRYVRGEDGSYAQSSRL